MRKLAISDAGIMRLALQQEIARSEESRYDHRLHGVLLVSHGISCYQVAEWLGKIPELSNGGLNDLRSEGLLDCRRDNGLASQYAPACSVGGNRTCVATTSSAPWYHQNLWDGKLLGTICKRLWGGFGGASMSEDVSLPGVPSSKASFSYCTGRSDGSRSI